MKAEVTVELKKSILDPQAKTAMQALEDLGFSEIENIVCKKLFVISCKAEDKDDLRKKVNDMCRKLLVNEITENHTICLIDE